MQLRGGDAEASSLSYDVVVCRVLSMRCQGGDAEALSERVEAMLVSETKRFFKVTFFAWCYY